MQVQPHPPVGVPPTPVVFSVRTEMSEMPVLSVVSVVSVMTEMSEASEGSVLTGLRGERPSLRGERPLGTAASALPRKPHHYKHRHYKFPPLVVLFSLTC